MKTTSKPHWQTQYTVAASNFWNLFRFNNQLNLFSLVQDNTQCTLSRVFLLVCWVRGRRQAHNPTLTKIMRLTYNRSCSHNRPQTAACNAVYSISRRALLITRLGEQLPRPSLISLHVRPPNLPPHRTTSTSQPPPLVPAGPSEFSSRSRRSGKKLSEGGTSI